MELWWVVAAGLGLATLGLVAVVSRRFLVDPLCPQCHGRDWSKGISPWRCRRCGARHAVEGGRLIAS